MRPRQNKIWQSIKTAPKDGSLCIIATLCHLTDDFTKVYASYWDGAWFLPFDSQRDEAGTPFLKEDEQPTHWMQISASQIKQQNN